MTLLDAYALVAVLTDEPAAAEVEHVLRGAPAVRVVTVNLAEAVDVSQRVVGLPNDEVRRALEPLFLSGGVTAVPSAEEEAWLAGRLRARHYDRKLRALSIADCLLVAHAVASDEEIVTADPALAAVARAEEVGVVALPDSAGNRP